MIFGNGTCVHNGACPPGLDGATKFAYSPDGTLMATDPARSAPRNRFSFAVTGAVATPFSIHIAMPHMSCVPAQWEWLPDGSGFAYVRMCTASRGYDLALVTVLLHGGRSHVLTTLSSRDPGAIDLTRATRCVGCGG
jgi:hypothetical protein